MKKSCLSSVPARRWVMWLVHLDVLAVVRLRRLGPVALSILRCLNSDSYPTGRGDVCLLGVVVFLFWTKLWPALGGTAGASIHNAGPGWASGFLARLPPGSFGGGGRDDDTEQKGAAPSIFSRCLLPIASVAVLIWSSWSHSVGCGPACAVCAASVKTTLNARSGDVSQGERERERGSAGGEVCLVLLSCRLRHFQILLMRLTLPFISLLASLSVPLG